MGQNKVHATKKELLDHLISVVQELPAEKIVEVTDFVEALKNDIEGPRPERGSLAAILKTMDTYGPLQFAPGELEELLSEISSLRELDLDKNG